MPDESVRNDDVEDRASSILSRRYLWRWFGFSAFVVIADQLAKLSITNHLELYQRIHLTPFFDLVLLHNTGAAFSFLAGADGWQNRLFIGIAVVVSAIIVWWIVTLPGRGRNTLLLGLTMVLGGAVGNLIDRIVHGYVVDFLLLYYRDWSWPAFNIADSAITCGVALILLDSIVLERRRSQQ